MGYTSFRDLVTLYIKDVKDSKNTPQKIKPECRHGTIEQFGLEWSGGLVAQPLVKAGPVRAVCLETHSVEF